MLRSIVAATLIAVSATASSAAPKRDVAEKASDAQDKVICKRFVETGSLVKGYRTCKTKREWEIERDAVRMQRVGGNSCPSGAATCN